MPRYRLTQREIDRAMAGDRYPPLLTSAQAARMLGMALSTFYKHAAGGRFRAARSTTNPPRYWRDRLLRIWFG